jgi:hypothetical protein
MRYTALITGLIALLAATAAADRGSVPFKPGVEIYEPKQQALIAWNGEEEILILATDLRASEATKVLEIIPLPNKPKITEANPEIINEAVSLINTKMRERYKEARVKGEDVQRPLLGGVVSYHTRIGAHDISVTKAVNKERFVAWLNSYLRTVGADTPTIPPELTAVVEEYLADGYVWFAVDVISVENTMRSVEPISYRFRTDKLYYPLRITRTEVGHTQVDLIVVTRERLKNFPGIHTDRVVLIHEPVEVNTLELRRLSVSIDDLLNHPETCLMRIWEIRGRLSNFRQDLLAH